MTFHYRYKKQILIGGILLVLLLGVGFGIFYKYALSNKKITNDKLPVLIAKTDEEIEEIKEEVINVEVYQVDVKGQVINPGLYQINAGSRVMDAINLAGGLTEFSDTSVINLSKKVFDEMVIIVYSKDEVSRFLEVKEEEKIKEEHCIQKEEDAIINDACIEDDSDMEKEAVLNNTKISINTATIDELQTLPGIGEAKAKDIISYREENGSYQTIEDIMNVSGIGESLFAKIKDYITV